jgi:hypothetical protein
MPTSATFDSSSAMSAIGRALALAMLVIGSVLAVVFAFAAAVVAGLLVLGAAIALRFAPKRARPSNGPETLDARRTPDGWVVETRRSH